MRVNEIMSKDVYCIEIASTIREAAEKMRELNIGALPVKENDAVVGLLTDRDIVVRCIADGADPNSTHVEAVMTDRPVFCLEEQSIEDAAELMERNHVRRLLVAGPEDDLVGIISLGDLAARQPDTKLSVHVSEKVREQEAR